MSGITLAMIVKDEADWLPRCLASVQPWVDAMVIVDTGSTDATPTIAAEAGATVLHVPWTQDFSAARNAALAAVQTPWTLVLDADETLVAADGPALHQWVAAPQADAYNLRVISLADRPEHLSEAYVTRLFRTDPRIRWTGRVHEQLIPSLQRHGLSLALAPIRILHAGYLPAMMASRQKTARNRTLLEAALRDQPHDAYTLWQLAQTVLPDGETEAALRYLRRADRNLPARHPLRPLIAVTRIKAAIVAEDWRHAQTYCHAALREWPQYTDLAYLAGQIALQRQDWPAAVQRFHQAYDLGVPQGFLQTETGVATFKPLWGLVQCMRHAQEPTKLVAYLLLLLKTAPAFRPGWQGLAEVYAQAPIETVGRQLQAVMTPAQIATALRLWTDWSLWELALLSWVERQMVHADGRSTPSPAKGGDEGDDPGVAPQFETRLSV